MIRVTRQKVIRKRRTTPLEGAYNKGLAARRNGTGYEDNPYPDHRGGDHGTNVTWSRAFRKAWFRGWMDLDRSLRKKVEQPTKGKT